MHSAPGAAAGSSVLGPCGWHSAHPPSRRSSILGPCGWHSAQPPSCRLTRLHQGKARAEWLRTARRTNAVTGTVLAPVPGAVSSCSLSELSLALLPLSLHGNAAVRQAFAAGLEAAGVVDAFSLLAMPQEEVEELLRPLHLKIGHRARFLWGMGYPFFPRP